MKKERIQSLTATFKNHAQHAEAGVEYWSARNLQHLLGYANFSTTTPKAKVACTAKA